MLLTIKYQTSLVVLFLTCYLKSADSVACLGCVDLDELSFDRTINRFPYALVKFDIAFPYGDKHTEFSKLARSAHQHTADLLIATVGIKDYGEMENKALGARFGYQENNLPGILLFKGRQKLNTFPAHLDVTEANLKQFINDNTPLYLGCDGCLKQFNVEIKRFANLSAEQQLAVISKLEQLLEELTDAEQEQSGKAYVAFARKIHAEGYEFVERETKRLRKLKAGRVTQAKKEELKRKLNILDLFRVNKLEQNVVKNEL